MPVLHTDSPTTQWLTYGAGKRARRHFANYDHSATTAMGILFRAESGPKPEPRLLSESLASFRRDRRIRYIIGDVRRFPLSTDFIVSEDWP